MSKIGEKGYRAGNESPIGETTEYDGLSSRVEPDNAELVSTSSSDYVKTVVDTLFGTQCGSNLCFVISFLSRVCRE